MRVWWADQTTRSKQWLVIGVAAAIVLAALVATLLTISVDVVVPGSAPTTIIKGPLA